MEIFLYLKFRYYLFAFCNLSLYSVFHIFEFAKELVTKKNLVSVNFNSVLQFFPQISGNHDTFQDIIVDEQDFTCKFNKFFQKTSLFFSQRLPS